MTGKEFPLIFADAGKTLLVAGFDCGIGIKQRLAEKGLTVGSHVSIVSGTPCGPLVIDVRGSRLGLGCGIAHKIMVSEVTDEQDTDFGGKRINTKPAVIN
jgi:Fe2+ transport system protein FeoA